MSESHELCWGLLWEQQWGDSGTFYGHASDSWPSTSSEPSIIDVGLVSPGFATSYGAYMDSGICCNASASLQTILIPVSSMADAGWSDAQPWVWGYHNTAHCSPLDAALRRPQLLPVLTSVPLMLAPFGVELAAHDVQAYVSPILPHVRAEPLKKEMRAMHAPECIPSPLQESVAVSKGSEESVSSSIGRYKCSRTRAKATADIGMERRRQGVHAKGVLLAPSACPHPNIEEECAAICAQIDAGGDVQRAPFDALRGSVWRLSLDPIGCRTVQHALNVGNKRILEELVSELRGHVREAVPSPHANYVIQKVIEVMPMQQLGFILEELAGRGACTSRHRFGCRIMCRLFEHSARDPAMEALVDEILAEAGALCRHVFGHHVIHSVLEHGHARQQQYIAHVLRQDLIRNATNRSASYVIEKALAHCATEDCQALVVELLANSGGVVSLAQSQYGCYVVKSLLRFPGEQSRTVCSQLHHAARQLANSKYGKRLLQDLGLVQCGSNGDGGGTCGGVAGMAGT